MTLVAFQGQDVEPGTTWAAMRALVKSTERPWAFKFRPQAAAPAPAARAKPTFELVPVAVDCNHPTPHCLAQGRPHSRHARATLAVQTRETTEAEAQPGVFYCRSNVMIIRVIEGY